MSYTDREVRTYARNHTVKETLQHFGIGITTLHRIIGKVTLRRPWFDTDVLAADMRKFHNNVPLLAAYYGITASALYSRLRRLKLKGIRYAWTKKDDTYLSMNMHIMHIDEIAKKLKRTSRAVFERGRVLNISYNSALGYTCSMVAADLGVNTEHVSHWVTHNRLPVIQHESGRRSYDITEVYNWLASGNALRLNMLHKRNTEIQEIYEQCKVDFVGALELQAYGLDTYSRVHAPALRAAYIGRAWGFGSVFLRAFVADYLVLQVPRLQQRALPGEDWYQTIIDRFNASYITSQHIAQLIGKQVTGSVYYMGLPRPLQPGVHYKPAVIQWLQESGKYPAALEALHGK